ncbi:MAG TPA: hypothetical protein PLP11_10530 [Bacteroidales bacterium]|nr:hypothetical protein [Bacteroidales bacterium]HQP05027.1 hypothetical protein [Bacteroidales bacterium]
MLGHKVYYGDYSYSGGNSITLINLSNVTPTIFMVRIQGMVLLEVSDLL